jgi:diguanylate cyclase (GGDEF)-like protein
MTNELSGIEPEQLKKIIGLLSDCTDEYLFIYNLSIDRFSIASSLVTQFNLPSTSFEHASLVLKNIISTEDIPRFNKECEKLMSGQSFDHSIEYRIIDKNKNIIWLSSRGRVMIDTERNERLLIGRIMFIGQRMIGDNLTGLVTDVQLATDYRSALANDKTVSGYLMKIDIDNLGSVNEQYGNNAGDSVLKSLADCCRRVLPADTRIYRSQSDEVLFLNTAGNTADDAKRLYSSIKREVSVEEERSGYEIMYSISAGTVAFFKDEIPIDELLRKLDFALVQAKNTGKNNITLFNALSYNEHLRDMEMKDHLRDSVRHNFAGFELNYQPVVDAKTKELIGAEALLRWSCPELGAVVPDEFIPMLEQTGLIIPVGNWVLFTAFAQCAQWTKLMPSFRMSVNLSYVQIKRSDILTEVQMALEKTGVNPKNIALEITESGYLGGDNSLPQLTTQFSSMGIHIDIDDFGTGYSNLRYLQYLHADTLKLDYTFTNKAVHNEYDRNVIKHIAAMAHSINMTVCMEGVEFANEEKILSELGPDKYQGFFFGHPVNAFDFYDQHLVRYEKN